jgi:DNA polymerase
VPALDQYDDTAAAAAAMALPRALGDCAAALGLEQQKDDAGHRLMLQMTKPRKPLKGEDPTKLYWWDDEERMQRLVAYCVRDVETERAVRRFLLPLSEAERRVWLFDATMNDRGVPIDLDLVHALLRIVDQAEGLLDKQMAEATGGWVTACTQVARLTEWLQRQGVPAESLAKAALEELLALDLPPNARRAIEIRQAAAKTSTKKLKAMLACVSADGRARGQHLYHGASTGRWAGRLIQPQNMTRGTGTVKDPESAVPLFLEGSAVLIELVFGNVMSAVSDMLRACFAARLT